MLFLLPFVCSFTGKSQAQYGYLPNTRQRRSHQLCGHLWLLCLLGVWVHPHPHFFHLLLHKSLCLVKAKALFLTPAGRAEK